MGSVRWITFSARVGWQKTCCVYGADGADVHTKSERYIQIVTVESGSSRPKLVPTSVKTEDHTIRQMNVAVQIQHLDLWRQDAEDNVTVYFIGFPEFISASDLMDFKLLYTALRRWDVHVSDTAGCIDLTGGADLLRQR